MVSKPPSRLRTNSGLARDGASRARLPCSTTVSREPSIALAHFNSSTAPFPASVSQLACHDVQYLGCLCIYRYVRGTRSSILIAHRLQDAVVAGSSVSSYPLRPRITSQTKPEAQQRGHGENKPQRGNVAPSIFPAFPSLIRHVEINV